jgi:hypothetical protein
MSWFTKLWGWFRGVSSKVWAFVKPVILAIVKAEAQGYVDLIKGLVAEAEANGGTGQAKYDWVVAQLKTRLGSQFSATPYRIFDAIIHAAVIELSDG